MQNATGAILGAAPRVAATPNAPAATRPNGSADGADFASVLARPDGTAQTAARPTPDPEGDAASTPAPEAAPDAPLPDPEEIGGHEFDMLASGPDTPHDDMPSVPPKRDALTVLVSVAGQPTGEKASLGEGRPSDGGWPGNVMGAERQAVPDRIAQPSAAIALPEARGAGITLRADAAARPVDVPSDPARGTAAPVSDQRRATGSAEIVSREPTPTAQEGTARGTDARFAGALPVVPFGQEQTAGAIRPQATQGIGIAFHPEATARPDGLAATSPEALTMGLEPGRIAPMYETAAVPRVFPATGGTGATVVTEASGQARAGWRNEAVVTAGPIQTAPRDADDTIADRAQEVPARRARSIPEVEFLSRFHNAPPAETVTVKARKAVGAALAPGGKIAEPALRLIGSGEPFGGVDMPRSADHWLPQHQAEQRAATVGAMPGAMPRPDAAPVFRQIAQAMPQVANGTVEVALSPEELGTVRLRFVPGEAGMVVHVTADRPETLDLMRRHVDQLAQDLARSGHNASGFTFEREGSERRAPARPRTDPEPSPLPASGPQADPSRRSAGTPAGGIDIRV